jgi:hypothetical protein
MAKRRHGLTSCPISDVFKNEAELEQTIRNDPVAQLTLSQILNVPIATLSQQVYVSAPLSNRQRADLVAATTDGSIAVIELTVRPLDANHLNRATGYAFQLGLEHIIFITPRATKPVRQQIALTHRWFEGVSRQIKITTVILRTYKDPALKSGRYSLEVLHQPIANAQAAVLQLLASATERAGDPTLTNVAISENRQQITIGRHRLVVYVGDQNLSIYCYAAKTQIVDDLARLTPSLTALGLKHQKREPQRITFAWPTPTITPNEPHPPTIDQIAVAFLQIRRTIAANNQPPQHPPKLIQTTAHRSKHTGTQGA